MTPPHLLTYRSSGRIISESTHCEDSPNLESDPFLTFFPEELAMGRIFDRERRSRIMSKRDRIDM